MQNSQTITMAQQVITGFVALILGRKVPVHWGNNASMMPDGSIMLPRPQVGDASEVAWLTRLAVHEAGHVEHTDLGCFDRLDPDTLGVFNLLEDPRMEMRQIQNYPGANLILSRSLDDLMARAMNNVGLDTEEERSRLVQLDILVRGMLAVAPKEVYLTHGQTLRTLSGKILSEAQSAAIDACVARIPTLANSQECEALAAELISKLRQPPQPEDVQDQEAGDQGQTDKTQHDEGSEDTQASEDSQDLSRSEDGPPSSPVQQDESPPADDGSGDADGTPESRSSGTDADAQSDAASDSDQAQASPGQDAADQGPPQPSTEAGDGAGQATDNPVSDAESSAGVSDVGQKQQPAVASEATQAQATGDATSAKAPLPEFTSAIDLGDLLRETLRETYGESPDEGDQSADSTQASPEVIEALEQLLKGDAQDLETMLSEAKQLVEAVMAADQVSDEQEPHDMNVLSELPKRETMPGAGLDLRLQGVESRLVHVLLRELQDRRKRPTGHARAGAQVATQRYWRLQQLGDTKVFKARNTVTGIDAAVTILLDRSGSMDEILETAARTALAFSFALQRVGNVRTSVAMFPSYTTFAEELQGFGRPPREAAQRCESLVALGSTPVAQAILEELPKLLAQRKRRNLMVVITDDGPDSPQLLQAAMEESSRQGVDIVGIGIGCDVSDYYPMSTSIHHVEELPGALEVLFRNHVAKRLAA